MCVWGGGGGVQAVGKWRRPCLFDLSGQVLNEKHPQVVEGLELSTLSDTRGENPAESKERSSSGGGGGSSDNRTTCMPVTYKNRNVSQCN